MQKSWRVFLTLFIITGYRNAVPPGRVPSCRFSPTCSQYALGAVGAYGLLKGGWLTLRRLFRCQPLSTGGYDPVP